MNCKCKFQTICTHTTHILTSTLLTMQREVSVRSNFQHSVFNTITAKIFRPSNVPMQFFHFNFFFNIQYEWQYIFLYDNILARFSQCKIFSKEIQWLSHNPN